MSLAKLLKFQWLYCLLGVVFNVVSWMVLEKAGKALTPTAPVSGLVVMAIYGFFLLAGHFKKISVYRILMVVAILALGYGGIFTHFKLLNQSPALYHSLWMGIIAISINAFGLVLNGLAALGRFEVGHELR